VRKLLALPLLLIAPAACNVDNDSGNDQVRIEYNQQKIEDAARSAASTAKEVGVGVGNVAASAGRAVKNEVGDIDVDVKRTPRGDGNSAADASTNAR
jgi:hypothetical protein